MLAATLRHCKLGIPIYVYKAFPCSDYYGGSVAMPDIHRSEPNSLTIGIPV